MGWIKHRNDGKLATIISLNHLGPMLNTNKNLKIELQRKSIDYVLYEWTIVLKWVNPIWGRERWILPHSQMGEKNNITDSFLLNLSF